MSLLSIRPKQHDVVLDPVGAVVTVVTVIAITGESVAATNAALISDVRRDGRLRRA